ncbi:MAG: beta-ketoacyl synthase N-terminal-like domain-containing protein [Anaeromyxobacter sp.]
MSAVGPIAIVGLGCRFAGGAGPSAFFDRCASGAAPARAVPPTRFDPEALAHELPPGARLPMRAALVDEVPLDWKALRIPPIQVEGLHLGERLALQTIVEAIQDAGLPPGPREPLDRAQVWLAATTFGSDERIDPMRRIRRYRLAAPIREALERHAPGEVEPALALLDQLVDLASPSIEPDALFTSASIVAGRATHLSNFRGGHLAIDAGTVSSLAAVAEASAALAREECDLAIVCGVAPLVTASALLAFAHRGELCPGAPAPYARAPAGTLLGEGAFAVALTRPAEAVGRRVYAVIEGIGAAAEPRDAGDAGLERCVARAAREALLASGVSPDAIHAVSSRAAGLPSDAAEAAGLADAYRGRSAPLAVASCVPATGHLRCAGGLAALVQAAVALQRGAWPAPPSRSGDLVGGVVMAGASPVRPEQRVAVSDAGPEPVAYHAVLARPGAPAAAARPAARRARQAEGFAVVGVGLVAADANDPRSYWKNVLEGSDPVRDLPASRFDVEALVGRNAELAHAFRTRLAATVSPPPLDLARYGIAPQELPTLDPAIPIALLAAEQALRGARWERSAGRRGQAVFGQLSLRARDAAVEMRIAFASTLALASEALREAGLSPERIREVLATARALYDARGAAHWTEALSASTGYSLAARVAGAFGLGGVPLTVDAACASSLAAVRLACDALARGEVDLALAGGVAYNLLPEYYVGLGLMGALSPRGALPFHENADGFVPAEGAAAVALRRLADARADGDEILAVVRGHGISSDGRALSIYSPSSEGQQLALRRALADAGVEPGTVDLLEAHGPATQLGDRTEIASCAAVYGDAPRPSPLVLSASKSQVGHTTSAAGMIALVRAVLALGERVLPGSNRRGELDPELHLERIPAVLPTTPRPWLAPRGHPRRAAVSAFGLAGVNHHLILEEAPGAAEGEVRAPVTVPPASGLAADRFAIELAPVALPERPPLHALAGRRAVVVGAPGGRAEALAQALVASGLQARRLDPPASGELELEGVSLVVDATALEWDPGLLLLPAAALAAQARAHAQRAVALARSIHGWMEDASAERPAMYAAVTAMGGDLGLSGGGAGNVLGAFQHGLALALKQELPAVLVKALDAPPGLAAPELARELLRELEDGNERVQVGWAGRRFVVNLRRAAHPDEAAPLRELRPGDVFVFSGGGRGVVFECARAVAQLGAVAVVTGRTAVPDPGAPHVGLDDEAFAEFRRREIVRRRGEPGLTPARFEREMAPLVRERELHRNLARARAEGLAIEYEPCDVVDPESVRALVARVRARHGAIHYLGHGAMIERSTGLPSKTDQDVARTVDSKVAGLLNLLDATAADPIRAVIAFGSGVARFGNRGQTDYAGANALMAALLPARLARAGHPAACVTVNWPAWREVGWAASNRDIAAGLDAMGVTSILPEEGRYWFLSELLHGTEPEVLVAGERMLHAWPFFGASADGRRPIGPTDDRAALLVPGSFPLLDEVIERGPGRLLAARRLDPDQEPFLAQHLLDGRPVLPGAFALEMLAEAASLLRPGADVVEAVEFRVDAPVVNVRGAVDVQVEAVEVGPGLVEARLLKRLAIEGAPPRIHASARLRLGERPARPGASPIPEAEGVIRARSFYRTSRDPVALGPLFCRAQWIELRGTEAVGFIESPDPGGIVGGSTCPAFRIDPLLLDSAFQLAGSVEGFGEGFVCVPVAVQAVRVGDVPRRGERARGRAVRARAEAPRVFYDVVVVGEDGRLLLDVVGLELRRVAQAEAA